MQPSQWKDWMKGLLIIAVAVGLGACDDGSTDADSGVEVDVGETDGDPPPDPDMATPDPDMATPDPDMAVVEPDEGPPPECTEDIDCAVDSPCIAATCVEGMCQLDEIEGCCVEDEDCQDGETCDLENNACVSDPCAGVECNEPPAPECDENGDVVTYASPGQCSVVEGEAECGYLPETSPCDDGFVCADGECVQDTFVDDCVFAGPADAEAFTGTPVTLSGRLLEAGLTDATDGVDAADGLLAEAGWGPPGAGPLDEGWMWAAAEADPAWNAADAGADGFDQYLATVDAPAPGDYALVFRFSLDDGATWTWCDLDGAANGFQPEQAGALTSLPGPCDGDPCAELPAPTCDGDTVVTYVGEGACEAVEGEAQCSFDEERQDCAAAGGRCEEGACVDLAPAPAAGEVIVTEILYDAIDPLTDGDAEWFEVHNTTDGPRFLGGCEVYDDGGNVDAIEALLIPAGGYALFGHTDDFEINGGLRPDALFEFRLGNDGDTIGLRCGDAVIDEVTYGDGFPPASGGSIQLDPLANDGAGNDEGANWCLGVGVYFGEGTPTPHTGSPGAANPPCPPPAIDYCRLQGPEVVRAEVGSTFAVFGVIFEDGVTDNLPGVDPFPGLLIDAGYGPDGSDPAANDDWQWAPAAGDPEWNGDLAGEITNDGYRAELTVPDNAGEYDFAYRVSLDEGATWTFCDLGAGSEDGYAPANAGQLTAIPAGADPCEGFVCPPPPAAFCDEDGVTVVEPQGPGACEAVDGQAGCTYPEQRLGCPPGDRCITGQCFTPEPPPEPGMIVISEIMYDATGDLNDSGAEWIELHNITGAPLGLDGCLVGDSGANVSVLEGINIAPGAYIVLARSADPAANGGLDVDGTFDFGLGNGGDSVYLQCGDQEIDRVTYDDVAFPEAQGYSISLDPSALDAETNDDGAQWCRTLPVYYESAVTDHHGTPGAPNPQCPLLGICTVLGPDEANVAVGADVEMTALLVTAGVTDRTRGVDDDPRVRAELGYGPDGSEPGPDWTWFLAGGDPENDAANADTYGGELTDMPAGRWDGAFRFSVDDGRTWTACDREPGSINGYQPADAVQIVVGDPGDPCDPNPCQEPPASVCADADNLTRYAPVGACVNEGGAAVCEYAEELVACPLGCVDGACVQAPARAPLPGDLVISEILYDPHNGLEDNTAEWFEIYNSAEDPITLEGCRFADANNEGDAPAVVLDPQSYSVFARSDDPALNGGLENVAGTFDFGLNNTDDTLTISCGGIVIDQVVYDEQNGFPPVRGFAIQVRDGQLDLVGNDFPESWCPARVRYSEEPAQWGSPGLPNPPCDSEVDFCRLQFPTDLEAEFETVQIFYGRVYEEGVTDISALNDSGGLIRAEFGFGPDGSLPAENEDWMWFPGFPNGEYDGAGELGEPNNDEFRSDIVMPLPGEYDTAVRFSVDGGRTWLHCDGGDAGSSDGYQAENAGRLVVTPPENPCDPNPCNMPPRPFCDGNTAVTYPELGQCAPGELGLAECSYEEARIDCGDDVCVGGACGGARPPAPGEVVISEFLYDPHNGLAEDTAEWIELYNTTQQPLALDGCEIADSASGSPLVGIEIAAQGYVLLGRNDDPGLNGGLELDGLFEFSLTNGGDSITFSCGGEVIDTLAYDDGPIFPDARQASVSLSPDRLDALANDNGANWCLGVDPYFADPQHLGTPGGPNPACPLGDPCDPNPCPPPPEPACEGNVAVTYALAVCEAVEGQAQCLEPEEIRQDCGQAGCVNGACNVAGARAPAAGEIVVTEVMFNTDGALQEQFAEWFELYNTTDEALSLDGCEVRDRANGLAADGITVGPGGYLLFARSLDGGINGGLLADGVFNFSLNNGGDVVELRCGVETIDAIEYGIDGFPQSVAAVAQQLDPDLFDAELNDLGDAWCNATREYFADPPHFGTPGLPNSPCEGAGGACDPNPCVDVPADECLDPTNLAAYLPEGICSLESGLPVCDYDFDIVDCAARGQVCAGGACVDAGAVPQEGDVVITELMYDPHFALTDEDGEWVELVNVSDRELRLDGCTLGIDGRNDALDLQLVLGPQQIALFVSNDNAAVNGGLVEPDGVFAFPLGNGGARVQIRCGDTLIDEVAYDDGGLFPDARAASISLDPAATNGVDNDNGANWCLGEEVYFADPDGVAEQNNLGTPGLPNPPCPEVDVVVDFCTFQFPIDPVVAGANDIVEVFGIVYEEGITDRTPLGDFDGQLTGEAGFGPRGSDPSDPAWVWFGAGTNPGWNGEERGQPDNDEYVATLSFFGAQGGDYDIAFRFSLDQGQTHLYCDLDGSENGYSSDQAVDLTLEIDPCENVFCFEPPPSFCQDATTVAFYGGDGRCEVNDQGQGECIYEVSFTDNCAGQGLVCVEDPLFGAICGDGM